MDTVSTAKRSQIMSRVRQKDTTPEILLRSALHQSGLRYRLHEKTLPGRPDLTFPRSRCAVLVHGCFWHSHGCYRSSLPKSRREYWKDKLRANQVRDQRVIELLHELGWRVIIVWECALVGKLAVKPERVAGQVRAWLTGTEKRREISGEWVSS